MRALHRPSVSVHESKNAPHAHAATAESAQATVDIEVVRPAWPRCSARKRLKRFSPVHTTRQR